MTKVLTGVGGRGSRVAVRVLYSTLVFLLAMWPFVLDNFDDLKELFSRQLTCSFQQEDVSASYKLLPLYNWSFRGKQLETSAVTLLSLDPETASMESDRCKGRAFMAALLTALEAEAPKVVVVDKFYGLDTCGAKDGGTAELQRVVADYPVPIVFGGDSKETETKNDVYCLDEVKTLLFGGKSLEGSTRLDSNTLRVPVRLALHAMDDPDQGALIKEADSRGLAYAAAEAADPGGAWHRRIGWFLDDRAEHPFVPAPVWGKTREIEEQPGEDVLCLHGGGTAWDLDCSHAPATTSLAGKIVVIGARSEQDRRLALEASLYGFELQAHYIAALLGGAYLAEWVLWLQLAVALLVMYVVERMIHVCGLHGHVRLHGMVGLKVLIPVLFRKREVPNGGLRLRSMVVLTLLCGGLIAILVLSPSFGFLIPVSLVASVMILYVSKLTIFLSDELEPEVELEGNDAAI